MLGSGNSDANFPLYAAAVVPEALPACPPMAIFPAASRCFGQDHPCSWLSDLVDDDTAYGEWLNKCLVSFIKYFYVQYIG